MHRNRRGFSLMEVLLSTSILMGSTIVLVELATIGRKQANSAYQQTTAQLLCQAKLNELAAGVEPLMPIEEHQLENEPGWLYSVTVEPRRTRQLVAVRVSVFQEPTTTKRGESFSLVRWLPESAINSTESRGERGPAPSPQRPETTRPAPAQPRASAAPGAGV